MEMYFLIYNLFCLFIIIPLIICMVIKLTMRCCIGRYNSNVSMTGKVIIVTGANSGIGFEIAKNLSSKGVRVILACRNEFRGTGAREQIISETGKSDVVFKKLNLSSLNSIRRFADDIKSTEKKLDVLVNNAGIYGFGDRFTEDNIIEGMQVNHFGPFLLTLLLLPMLMESRGRIVNVNSIFQYIGRIDFDNANEVVYNKYKVYADSKLWNVMFTVELAKRLFGTGVTINAVHPGIVYTNITGNMVFIIKVFFKLWCWICSRSVEEGARTVIYLCAANECANITGKFFYDCIPRYISREAQNAELRAKLWSYSAKLVGYDYDDPETINYKQLI